MFEPASFQDPLCTSPLPQHHNFRLVHKLEMKLENSSDSFPLSSLGTELAPKAAWIDEQEFMLDLSCSALPLRVIVKERKAGPRLVSLCGF
jgi:hypothetical protein